MAPVSAGPGRMTSLPHGLCPRLPNHFLALAVLILIQAPTPLRTAILVIHDALLQEFTTASITPSPSESIGVLMHPT